MSIFEWEIVDAAGDWGECVWHGWILRAGSVITIAIMVACSVILTTNPTLIYCLPHIGLAILILSVWSFDRVARGDGVNTLATLAAYTMRGAWRGWFGVSHIAILVCVPDAIAFSPCGIHVSRNFAHFVPSTESQPMPCAYRMRRSVFTRPM